MTLSRTVSAMQEWPAWKEPYRRDGLLLLGLALATYAAAHFLELPPYLLEFALENPQLEVDDLIFVVFIVSAAVMTYGARRYRDVARENRARIAAERESHHLARHDPLTALPNRRFFEEKLNEDLRGYCPDRRFAVLMLDLDGFKAINDIYGHAAGDAALIEFARRVSCLLDKDAFFARIGGDEFSIMLPCIAAVEEAADLAARIKAAVVEPVVIEGASARLGVGIGIAVAPDHGDRADQLVRRADRALYSAKATRPSSPRFFEPEMDALIERRVEIERELRAAIASDSIAPHFQPIVSLDGNRIIGFEALARWESARLGSVPPADFIPVAEETGLIVPLGEKLLHRACFEAKSWPQPSLC